MPENPRKAFGRSLKRHIKAQGYQSLEKFAYENGFDKSWIARIVRGDCEPGIIKISRVADALGVGLDELYPKFLREK